MSRMQNTKRKLTHDVTTPFMRPGPPLLRVTNEESPLTDDLPKSFPRKRESSLIVQFAFLAGFF